MARSRLRERRAIKRSFPSTSADGSGTCSLRKHDVVHPTLFFTPRHGRSGRRTCTEGFIVLTEIARVLVNCKAFARYLKGGAKEIAYLITFFFFFSHLSIYFCQVSNKREMVEIFYSKWYGIRGEDHLLSYLRQVDACSLFVFVIIRTPLGRQLIPFSQIFLILIPILLWLMSNLSNSKFFIDSGFYSSINETSDNFYYFFKREGLLKFSLNIYEVSYKVYP